MATATATPPAEGTTQEQTIPDKVEIKVRSIEEGSNVAQNALAALHARQEFLRPFVEEHEQITALLRHGENGKEPASRPRQSSNRGGRQSAADSSGVPTKGRAKEMYDLVQQRPGITAKELAEELNIGQVNYVYRVMGGLQKKNVVRKDGQGFHAAA